MKDLMHQDASDVARVRQSFCRGLGTYHAEASEQARIARYLGAMLAETAGRSFARAFEFGCGTGHLTRALSKGSQVSQFWLNDLVPECEDAALGAVAGDVSATFQSGPIETATIPSDLDLIASASTVQWVADQPALLARLSDHLAPGGWLALSGFGHAQFQELATLGSGAGAPGYRDAEEWEGILPRDLELVAVRQTRITRHFKTARAVLRHLRDTGVNGNARGGWTRAALGAFEAEYEKRFGTPEGLVLTYDPVWLVARKR